MSTHGISTKVIGGVTYSFHTLPASKAVHVHVALARVIGDAVKGGGGSQLLAAIGKQETTEADADTQMRALMSAIMSVSADDWVTPDGRRMMGLTSLMATMFEYVRAGGKSVDIDVNFTGRGRDIYLVLGEALRHNFAGFLGESHSPSSPGGAAA